MMDDNWTREMKPGESENDSANESLIEEEPWNPDNRVYDPSYEWIPPRRSLFGLVVTLLVTVFFGYLLIRIRTASGVGWQAIGLAFSIVMVRPLVFGSGIAAVSGFIAWFARFKWGYLNGAVMLFGGMMLLSSGLSDFRTAAGVLAFLMLLAFLLERQKVFRYR